jgi:epoxyqueuosine reductase
MQDLSSLHTLRSLIEDWSREEGFTGVGVADLDLRDASGQLQKWLTQGYQAEMGWMARNYNLRSDPGLLQPGALRAICFRMPYLSDAPGEIDRNGELGMISRYARGSDYHKLLRRKLARIAARIQIWAGRELRQRAFVDSAPVLEKPLASKAGLGWIGKNTLLLSPVGGSWYFLGEILTDLELPIDNHQEPDQCGKCRACMSVCPTQAFPEPYVLDASRCISYLTIEHSGAIPLELRPLLGNRVFGCDDCQLICPWSQQPETTSVAEFKPRHGLSHARLIDLFYWTEAEYLERTAGTPLRRAGYERWQRNLATALGNGPASTEAVTALEGWENSSALVREHVEWSLHRLRNRIHAVSQ